MKTRLKRTLAALAVCTAMLAAPACTNIPGVLMFDQIPRGSLLQTLSTDKAAYKPGEEVQFDLKLQEEVTGGTLFVRYLHMNRVVGEEDLKAEGNRLTWSWKPPQDDGKGYMTEVFLEQSGKVTDHLNIAVDVSSDWDTFPRYGYLADFHAMDSGEMSRVIDRLNRLHINSIQFYDWQYKHQEPIPLEDGKPAAQWKDIANRPVAFETVKGYIDLAHSRGMKAMNYNLLYGAYADADRDGVRKEWGLYKDPSHNNQDRHSLPKEWASDIYLYDSSNPGWQDYLIDKEKKTFEALPFDGWHVDQLGGRGDLWTYDGRSVNLEETSQLF